MRTILNWYKVSLLWLLSGKLSNANNLKIQTYIMNVCAKGKCACFLEYFHKNITRQRWNLKLSRALKRKRWWRKEEKNQTFWSNKWNWPFGLSLLHSVNGFGHLKHITLDNVVLKSITYWNVLSWSKLLFKYVCGSNC